jgi:hypothetical protein
MDFIKLISLFLEEIENCEYELSLSDHIWNLIFPDDKNNWYHIYINKYEQTYYITHVDGKTCTLEANILQKSCKVMVSYGSSYNGYAYNDYETAWAPIISFARKWLRMVRKDWIKANKMVYENYPLNRRYGIVSNALIRNSLKDVYRIDEDLGKRNIKKFVSLVESGYFRKENNYTLKSLTANDFFKYCKIAYTVVFKNKVDFNKNVSGDEMYKRYADGRHNGLLDIRPDSEQEFSDWIDRKHPKYDIGGHPWEIMRGGNTTHIDLYVTRPDYHWKEGYKVEFNVQALCRMKKAVLMFLALNKAGLPISIYDSEGIRKRLLAQDNIGIVPRYCSLHRANQHFQKEQCVYDVMHYDELGRYKRRIKPFITWEPFPTLKPIDCL